MEVYCQSERCFWFGVLDLDQLLEGAGTDCKLPDDGPDFACEKCGGELKFMLAFPPVDAGNGAED